MESRNRLILKFSDYKVSYVEKLKDFLNESEDNREIDFVLSQKEFYERNLESLKYSRYMSMHEQDYADKYYPNFTFYEYRQNRTVYYRRVLEFLDKRSIELREDKREKKNLNLSTPNIKFSLSQTELIELSKALIENGNVKGKQKDIINAFSSFFNIEINNPDKIIQDIKNRNTGSETLFIDKLKSSLYNYITKENTR